MRRKNAILTGNVLMGLGLITMIAGTGYVIVSQLPSIQLPDYIAHGAVFSIFAGAILWLAGARISGHEKVTDHYYWLKHCDDRCRRRSVSDSTRRH